MRPAGACLLAAVLVLACGDRDAGPGSSPAGGPGVAAIVDPRLGYLLGGARDGAWVGPAETAAALEGGESYQIYDPLRVIGPAAGDAPETAGDVCPGSFVVRLAAGGEGAGVALGGGWNALPRIPEPIGPGSPVDRAAVESFLREQGLAEPDVRITRILRVDLDGNGTTEVLVAATRATHPPAEPRIVAGDYSLVLVRRADRGGIRIPLVSEVHARDEPETSPREHELAGAFDLDGDGAMEVVVRSLEYEGAATSVFEIGESDARRVLAVECGV